MKWDPARSIVKILDKNEQSAGTGFVISARTMVTCAHVVGLAGARPGSAIRAVSRFGSVVVVGRVSLRKWGAPDREDVAVIELDEAASAALAAQGVVSARFGSSLLAQSQRLQTFGYSAINPAEGIAGWCEVVDKIRIQGFPIFQVRSAEVAPGFSGAPAWDLETGLVRGVVVSVAQAARETLGRGGTTAFLIPAETVRPICLGQFPEGCPYRGLETFTEEDKDFYFGRDPVINDLMSKLERAAFVTVVGVSGSGKSSLVQAGLAKGLERHKIPGLTESERCVITPGRTPLLSLLQALAKRNPAEYDKIGDELKLSRDSLIVPKTSALEALREQSTDYLAAILRNHFSGKNTILIEDQFERLYTECQDEVVRQRFLDILVNAAGEDLKIIVAIKSDYFPMMLQNPAYAEIYQRGLVTLASMTESELRDAIVLPAEAYGRSFEPDVIEHLIKEVSGRPGDLPLLQFALQDLWQKDAAGGVLTAQSYRTLGFTTATVEVTGARGAIVRRAEEVWQKYNDLNKGHALKQVFLALVLAADPGEGADKKVVLDASRRARLSEFSPETRAVAEELSSSFLLTTGVDPFIGEPTVEVAHEVLIRNWPRLRQWVEDTRPFLVWFTNDFSSYVQRWLDRGRASGYLLPEVELAQAEGWLARVPDLLEGPKADFIRASVQARQLRRRRTKTSMGALIGVLLVAAVVVATFFYNADRSLARDLQQRGVRALADRDYQTSQVMLAASLVHEDSQDTRQYLLEALAGGARGLQVPNAPGDVLALSEGGTTVAYRGPQGKIDIRDKAGNVVETALASTKKDDATVAFSKSGRFLLYGNRSGDVALWDRYQGTRMDIAYGSGEGPLSCPETVSHIEWAAEALPPGARAIHSVAMSDDDHLVAFGDSEGIIEMFDLAQQKTVARFCGHMRTVHVLAFAPNSTLASGGADRMVRIWSAQGKLLRTLSGHEDFVWSLGFSRDGNTLASAGNDHAIRIWDLAEGKTRRVLTGHVGLVESVEFSSSGDLAVSASDDGTVRLWDLIIGTNVAVFRVITPDGGGRILLPTAPVPAKRGDITAIAWLKKFVLELVGSAPAKATRNPEQPGINVAKFAGTEEQIVAGGELGVMRSWDVGNRLQGSTFYARGPVAAVAVDSNHHRIAASGHDGTISVWDLRSGSLKILGTERSAAIWSLAFGVGGQLASGGEDRIIRIWDLDQGKVLQQIVGSGGDVYGLTFHPTLPILASGEFAGDVNSKIHLWNATTGTEIGTATHVGGSVWITAISSDGHYLASGGGDTTVRIWDISDPKAPRFVAKQVTAPGNEVFGLGFDRAGKHLLSAGIANDILISSVPDLSELHRCHLKDVAVQPIGADLSNDGKTILLGVSDHTVRIIKSDSCQEASDPDEITLRAHDGPVWSVAFDGPNEHVVSGGLDHRVQLWNIPQIARILSAPASELLNEAQRDNCLSVRGEDLVSVACHQMVGKSGLPPLQASETATR